MGVSVSACMSDVKEVRELKPQSGSFNAELMTGYRELAIFEADEMYDWPDAKIFAKKALLTKNGQVPMPENPLNWRLKKVYLAEVEDAYQILNHALSDNFSDYAPLSAARAQIGFDCWVEQLEEGWQLDHIAACREKFDDAIQNIKSPVAEHEADSIIKVETQTQVEEFNKENDKLEKCHSLANNEVRLLSNKVHFLHNESKLGKNDLLILQKIAHKVKYANVTKVLINGHTDTSGDKKYNLRLSLERAIEVWGALVENGVSPKIILISAHGELSPKVNLDDGAREPRDRRAEINIAELQGHSEEINELCNKKLPI